jgi:Mn2+/Fe2+ NRAMP family transporter
MAVDPYIISTQTIKEPPASLVGQLKYLGPGFILSASIVGSGELIATTILGAKAGFIALWIIILSCLAKVAVQLEFGRHAILTGETTMRAFNQLPGPALGRGKWTVWILFVLILLKVVQLGGMLGGTVVILNMLYSGFSIQVWTFICAAAVAVMIYNGKYGIVEKCSMFMIAMFTVLTLSSLYYLRYTEYAFSFSEVLGAQTLKLSGTVIGFAIGAFGITGVASDEIIAYNYWCLEKGYAACTGPPTGTEDWRRRAKGWIRVMYLDAGVAMIIYTLVTLAFYLLGAAILHDRGEVPFGNEVIETVALIYTQSLGPGVKTAYLIGGFFVLFSSLFATLAAWTRIYPDIFAQMGWIDFHDLGVRRKIVAALSCVFPLLWALIYLYIELPVLMVLFGGLVGSFMLFIVIAGALHFKYGRQQLIPSSPLYSVAFWISVVSIFGVGVYGIVQVVS